LWEQRRDGERWVDGTRVASWAEQPISLAQDSVSGRANAELVDIGAGTNESDYANRDIRGRLVLTSSQPEAVADLAIGRYGAAGIVSWAQNQRTAWWGEDESLVRWGHLDTFGAHPTFAFMVSPARARAWQERLRRGETVRLRAEVDAGRAPSAYLIPTATIPGRRADQEIVYSCHLDHPAPGANDNASGCAGILEVARTLQRLVASGALPRPERTIRFIWPSEIEATIALLNARPEYARRTLATIHLDMIGGDTERTGSILRVHGSPPSLPSFVSDVGFAFADYVNAQSLAFASTGEAQMPLIDPQGSRRALQAEVGGFNMGSDHQVWAEGSFRVPVIYIADWPDRTIHTQRDVPDNLDPTKMRRAIFIAAASGYFLANASPASGLALERVRRASVYRRALTSTHRIGYGALDQERDNNVRRHRAETDALIEQSLTAIGLPFDDASLRGLLAQRRPSGTIFRRILREGPMDGFGYS
jgi:aminopeptidase YwaD